MLTPVILAARGGPAYLIEIDLEGMEAPALRALEGAGSETLKLAGRTAGAALLHASGEDLETLNRLGIEFDVVAEESHDVEYYIVGKGLGVEDALEAAEADILVDRAFFYVVAVSPQTSYSLHLLDSERRLSPVTGPAVPLRLGASAMAETLTPAPAFTYSPAVQAMVDEVDQTRLYDRILELSGEVNVVVGGETYRLDTRYSPTALCKIAGFYLKERFEELGLETEIHYFNFLRTLKSIYFPAGNQSGWAVGRGGVIIHTDDGGDTWWPQDSGLDIALNDVFMIDDYAGCVAANGGEMLYTLDGGDNWQQAITPTGVDLNKVYMTDANTGYACGDGGVMLKTTDGGASWFSLSSGTGDDLSSVVFVNSTDGWAVGEGGKIIRTENAGSSWSNASSPTSDDLMDVTFVGVTNGWISTATGNVLKTEDGGTWLEVSTPVTTSLRSVCFAPNGLTGWAAGLSGGVVKTHDGGDTWSDLSIYSEPVLWDIYFVDNNEGWVCGSAILLYSVNGAVDWDNQIIDVQDGDMNIIATKPGTVSPDEIYIICGHYDSISNNPYYDAPGADDNATGSLAALEAARVLLDQDYEATIRFVCFSREEQGLVGSNAYARFCANRGDSILGVLNFDMIGYVDVAPEEIEILHDEASEYLGTAYGDAAALYVPSLDCRIRNSPGSRSSDHASFWDQGYAAFCSIEDAPPVYPYYHRTTDRYIYIDFDFYEDVVKAAVATLAELARIDSTSAGVPGEFAAAGIRVLPNPCIGGATVELAGRVSPQTEVEFFDIRGRLVSKARSEMSGNRVTATWNAEDENGRPLSPGIYFARVAGSEETEKVILLK
ncbi:MAG: M20/M25/M40 family metallo-hydrolase [bacterium]|jgi:photosystem II stability/assembly factor-like uncharacterized protein